MRPCSWWFIWKEQPLKASGITEDHVCCWNWELDFHLVGSAEKELITFMSMCIHCPSILYWCTSLLLFTVIQHGWDSHSRNIGTFARVQQPGGVLGKPHQWSGHGDRRRPEVDTRLVPHEAVLRSSVEQILMVAYYHVVLQHKLIPTPPTATCWMNLDLNYMTCLCVLNVDGTFIHSLLPLKRLCFHPHHWFVCLSVGRLHKTTGLMFPECVWGPRTKR